LTILNLNQKEYSVLHWLTVLLENRTFSANSPLALDAMDYLKKNFTVNYKNYDCIVGYRADDSYFAYAQDFISGVISLRQLSAVMKIGKLGEQFVLKSRKAFDRIVFTEAQEVDPAIWFERKKERDREARAAYFNTERNRRQKGDLFILQILDEEIKADDSRLQ